MEVFTIIIFGLAVIRTYSTMIKEHEENKFEKSFSAFLGSLTVAVLTTWAYIWWLTTII